MPNTADQLRGAPDPKMVPSHHTASIRLQPRLVSCIRLLDRPVAPARYWLAAPGMANRDLQNGPYCGRVVRTIDLKPDAGRHHDGDATGHY